MAAQSKLAPATKDAVVTKPKSNNKEKRTESVSDSTSEHEECDQDSETSAQPSKSVTSSAAASNSGDEDMNYGTDGIGGDDKEDSVEPDCATPASSAMTPKKKPANSPATVAEDKDIVMCDCASNGPPFVASVRKCLSSNLYKDVAFKSAENTILKAHKIVVIPQSDMLTKIFTKTPSKKDVTIPFAAPVLKAFIRYMYNGAYIFDSKFKSEWELNNAGDGALIIEYHLKVLQLAAYMGIPRLEELATTNLKQGLKAGNFSDELYAKLQEAPKKSTDKKAPLPEVPFGVTEAVIEGGARKVKNEVDAGVDKNQAFHNVARTIDNRYLADFIQAVGNALGQQYRLYLRCPNCACHIRSKEGGNKDFACIRDDCGKQNALGQLCPDDRIPAAPTVAVADPAVDGAPA